MIINLQALRAVAAFLVFFHHFLPYVDRLFPGPKSMNSEPPGLIYFRSQWIHYGVDHVRERQRPGKILLKPNYSYRSYILDNDVGYRSPVPHWVSPHWRDRSATQLHLEISFLYPIHAQRPVGANFVCWLDAEF